MEGKMKLGYWAMRGRGQVLRLLLTYTGLDWEEVTYKEVSQWFGGGDKTKLGLEFPNLPYLINGEFKLTESNAIAKYIIRKSNKKDLLGKNAEDEARIEMVLSLLEDIFNPVFSTFFSPNHQNDKTRLFDNKVKVKMEELTHYIGNKEFAIGYLTLADFKLAEASYYFEKMYPELLNKFEVLFKIRKNVESLPEIKTFYDKGGISKPFLPTYAQLKF